MLWTCRELGLPLVREDWGSGFRSTQEPAFLALNPNGPGAGADRRRAGAVGVEHHLPLSGGREGRRDLLPQEPGARAAVEMWMDWQATDRTAPGAMCSCRGCVGMRIIRMPPARPPPSVSGTG